MKRIAPLLLSLVAACGSSTPTATEPVAPAEAAPAEAPPAAPAEAAPAEAPPAAPAEPAPAPALRATLMLVPLKGDAPTGTLTLEKVADGVRIAGTVTGLKPGEYDFGKTDECGGFKMTEASKRTGHVAYFDTLKVGDDGILTVDDTTVVMDVEGRSSIVGANFVLRKGKKKLACGVVTQ